MAFPGFSQQPSPEWRAARSLGRQQGAEGLMSFSLLTKFEFARGFGQTNGAAA